MSLTHPLESPADRGEIACSAFARSLESGLWKVYLEHLGRPEGGETGAFAPLIAWGMSLLKDDELLRYTFSVSRITLKRWATAETTPGPMARDSILRRLEKIAEERIAALV
jgi:hypothetical protein